jgi:hypothetical protein
MSGSDIARLLSTHAASRPYGSEDLPGLDPFFPLLDPLRQSTHRPILLPPRIHIGVWATMGGEDLSRDPAKECLGFFPEK